MAGSAAWTQVPAGVTTVSGPFWRTTATVSNYRFGCAVSLNGVTPPAPPASLSGPEWSGIIVEGTKGSLRVRIDCLAKNTAAGRTVTDATLQFDLPSEVTLARTGSFGDIELVEGTPFRSKATLSGTMSVPAGALPVTVTVEQTSAAPISSQTQRVTAGTTASLGLGIDEARATLTTAPASPAHDFGDGSQTAVIHHSITIRDMVEGGNFIITSRSLYKISRPLPRYAWEKVTVRVAPGQESTFGFAFTNAGGGLLNWKTGIASARFSGTSARGSVSTTTAPDQGSGLRSAQTANFTMTFRATADASLGVWNGEVYVQQSNDRESWAPPPARVPVEVTVAATGSDSVEINPVNPPGGGITASELRKGITATVSYRLQSEASGQLRLRLYDSAGSGARPLFEGYRTDAPVQRSDSPRQQVLTIAFGEAALAAERYFLRAELLNANGSSLIATSPWITYVIEGGDPAGTVRFGPAGEFSPPLTFTSLDFVRMRDPVTMTVPLVAAMTSGRRAFATVAIRNADGAELPFTPPSIEVTPDKPASGPLTFTMTPPDSFGVLYLVPVLRDENGRILASGPGARLAVWGSGRTEAGSASPVYPGYKVGATHPDGYPFRLIVDAPRDSFYRVEFRLPENLGWSPGPGTAYPMSYFQSFPGQFRIDGQETPIVSATERAPSAVPPDWTVPACVTHASGAYSVPWSSINGVLIQSSGAKETAGDIGGEAVPVTCVTAKAGPEARVQAGTRFRYEGNVVLVRSSGHRLWCTMDVTLVEGAAPTARVLFARAAALSSTPLSGDSTAVKAACEIDVPDTVTEVRELVWRLMPDSAEPCQRVGQCVPHASAAMAATVFRAAPVRLNPGSGPQTAAVPRARIDAIQVPEAITVTPGWQPATLATPDAVYSPLRGIWTFEPEIPEGRGFSAKLTFSWDAGDTPSGAGFRESDIRIAARDASGQLRQLATSVDAVARSASAQVSGLAPTYALLVPGDAAASGLLLPAPASSVTLTSVSDSTVSAVTETFESNGRAIASSRFDLAPAQTRTLGADATANATSADFWLRISDADPGIRLLGGTVPARAPERSFTFGALDETARIDVVNSSRFPAVITFTTRNAEGAVKGVKPFEIAGNGILRVPVSGLVDAAPGTDFPVWTRLDAAAGVVATAVQGTVRPPLGKLEGLALLPYVESGTARAAASLVLVNPGPAEAAALLAWGGARETVRIPAGGVTVRPLGPGAGPLSVDPVGAGLMGSVVLTGATGKLLAELPLTALTPAEAVFAPVSQGTVYLANAGAASVTAHLTLFGASGARIGETSIPVPPGDRISISISQLAGPAEAAGGQLRIGAATGLASALLLETASGDLVFPPALKGAASAPATEPRLEAPSLLDFGPVTIGQTATRNLTLSNTGSAALTVTAAVANQPAFSVATALPVTIQPGVTAAIAIRFTPSVAGAVSAALEVASNQAAGKVIVSLTGSGVAVSNPPRIEASPATVNFGTVAPRAQTTQPLTIRNTGGSPLTLSGISIADSRFTVTGVTAPLVIQSQGSASWTLRFIAGDATGAAAAVLAVTSDDPATPLLRVTLNATVSGTALAARARLTKTAIDFGAVAVGSQAEDLIELTNTGNTPLVVESIRTDNERFRIPGAGSFTLPVGSIHDLRVIFVPSAAREEKGVLRIVSNDPASPAEISLTGSGR